MPPVDTSSKPIILETFPAKAGYYVVTDVFLMTAKAFSIEDGKKDLEPIFVGTATGSPDEIQVVGQESKEKGLPQLQILIRGAIQPDGRLLERREYLINELWKDPTVTEADGIWEEGEEPQNVDDTDYRYRDGDTYQDKDKALNHWAQWMYGKYAEPSSYPGFPLLKDLDEEEEEGSDPPPPPTHEGFSSKYSYPRFGGKSIKEIVALSSEDLAKYEDAIDAEILKLTAPERAIVADKLAHASPWRETVLTRSLIYFIDLYQTVQIGEEAKDTDPALRDWLVSHVIDPLPSGSKIKDDATVTFSITVVNNPSAHPMGSDLAQSTLPFHFPKNDYEIPERDNLTKYQMRPTVLGAIVA
jgi:hypothetical protein